jgi:hypothetical protein
MYFFSSTKWTWLTFIITIARIFWWNWNNKYNSKHCILYIGGLQDLITIIPHFDKYPLLTQKGADFILWKQIVELMINKEHLTFEGFQNFINIKASINLGLSDVLISNFSNIIPVKRLLIWTKDILNPNWIAGFTTGEGNFDVRIHRSFSNKIGYQVQLRFRLTQHVRDVKLMVNGTINQIFKRW